MNKLFRSLSIFVLSLSVALPIFAFVLIAPAAHALSADEAWGGDSTGGKEAIGGEIGLADKDPRTIAASVIKVILGFLGIIAVVIILMGGFKWMTAGGEESKIDEAKDLIKAGLIGLVIILAAFGIANFVINSLLSATGNDA